MKTMKAMRKITILILIICALGILITGCSKSSKKDDEKNSKKKTSEESEDSRRKDDDDEEEEEIEEKEDGRDEKESEAVSTNEYSGTIQDEENDEESTSGDFSQFSNLEFYFSSGVGGWATVLYITPDGDFYGSYSDYDMGVTEEDYPNGTIYVCDFSGKFGDITKADQYRYKTTIEEINFVKTPDTQEIIDGVLYIYTTAYGLDGAEDIYLCLPGMPERMFSEEERFWVMYGLENRETTCYTLCNTAAEQVFCGYEIKDYSSAGDDYADTGDGRSDAEVEVDNLSTRTDDLVYELYNSDLSQSEMNIKSYDIYKLWDDELNKLYGQLKGTESFDEIQKEQRIWVEYKEKRVANAGASFEGGTMQPLVENMEAYKITKQRVYELIMYF